MRTRSHALHHLRFGTLIVCASINNTVLIPDSMVWRCERVRTIRVSYKLLKCTALCCCSISSFYIALFILLFPKAFFISLKQTHSRFDRVCLPCWVMLSLLICQWSPRQSSQSSPWERFCLPGCPWQKLRILHGRFIPAVMKEVNYVC